MAKTNAQRRHAFVRPLAALLVVLLIPVCTTLAMGGADWAVGDRIHITWFDDWVAWLVLAACALIAGSRARSEPLARDILLLAIVAFAAAVGILWSGGGRLAFVSFRSPDAMAWLGLALAGLGVFVGWRGGSARVGPRAWWLLPAGLVLGLLLQAGLMGADARRMLRRIDVAAVRAVAPGGESSGSRADLVWIVVDTLRADALGVYQQLASSGGDSGVEPPRAIEPPRTPFLDGLSQRAIVFERVIAPAPWTLPSMMSAFTARYPSSLDPQGRGRVRRADDLIALVDDVPTWIRVFRDVGYHTAAFQKNPFLGWGSGFERDFDLYRVVGGDRAERASGAQLVRSVLRWADQMARHRSAGHETPYLLYVHFMDPHVDYRPPDAWLSRAARAYRGPADGSALQLHRTLASGQRIGPPDRDQLRRLYAAEVAYLDRQIEELIGGLRVRGLLDEQTLIAVTADHGEQFAEHGGWEHGDLHIENVHVPMMISGSGLPAERVAETISAIDFGPTILEAAGLAPLAGAEGRSRIRRERDTSGKPGGDRVVHAAGAPTSGPVLSEYGDRIRLESGRWVLILGPGASVRLYDVERDPGEGTDLAATRPEMLQRLEAMLARHRARPTPRTPDALPSGAPGRALDDETAEALRALGYGD